MTYAKLLGYGFLLALGLACMEAVFYTLAVWETTIVSHALFSVLVVLFTTIAVRQLGYITVLEALVVLVVWLIFHVLLDVLVAGPLAGYGVLVDPNIAVGYVLFAVAIILFHSKRHVARRKQLASK